MSRPLVSGNALVLGTRGSALALAQVTLVEQALRAAGVDIPVEVKKIVTSGDRRSSADFSDVIETGAGVKGLFTKEIELALLDGGIDVAVHSCKDLPGHLADGLVIGATLPRANTADVYIGRAPFATLDDRSAVGTSSVRRRRQLLWINPCLVLEEMRGNVPTRIEKLRASDSLSGIVLARAGLERLRLDLGAWIVEDLPILPAIGQGAIALQCRAGDVATAALLARINHAPTFTAIRAERELLRLLDGDCHLPVGVATKLVDGLFSMQAIVFGEEGEPPRTGEATGPEAEPEKIAAELSEKSMPIDVKSRAQELQRCRGGCVSRPPISDWRPARVLRAGRSIDSSAPFPHVKQRTADTAASTTMIRHARCSVGMRAI